MSKSLIIAEKPSVAADIARVLGGFTRQGDYFESDRFVLSSAVGHLLEIGMPEDEEVKRGKWTFGHLPAIPSKFALKPIEKNEARLKVLLKLIKRKDVADLINACDAGREGELIFRYIVDFAKTAKPIRRLWLQSMTPASIRDGFATLRGDAELRPLADAARLPLRIGLAGRHQRHAGDDRVQFQVRRLPAHHRRPGPDADARDPGRARGEDPRLPPAQLLGGAGDLPRAGRRVHGTLVRRGVPEERRRARRPRRAALGRGAGAKPRRPLHGAAGQRQRGVEALDPDRAAALRPHQPAARGERPLRPLRPHHAVARAVALRKAQGAHLPADRLARAARGLRRHRPGDDGVAGRDQRLGRLRAPGAEAEVGPPQQADLRQRQDLRPLRDHPDAGAAEEPERTRGQAVRFRRQALPGGVLSRRRVPAHHADHPGRRRAVQDRGQGAGRARLARRLRQGGAGRRVRRCRPSPRARRSPPRRSTSSPARRARPRGSTRPRCCRRWKAPAS